MTIDLRPSRLGAALALGALVAFAGAARADQPSAAPSQVVKPFAAKPASARSVAARRAFLPLPPRPAFAPVSYRFASLLILGVGY